MAWNCELLQQQDITHIIQFEEARLSEHFIEPHEKMFQMWKSSAREESLVYYVRVGWSFKVYNDDRKIVGFILAQPLLFFLEHTQVLWVEYLSSQSLQARDMLIDVVYRLAKEKHLQGIYFPQDSKILNGLAPYQPQEVKSSLFISTMRK